MNWWCYLLSALTVMAAIPLSAFLLTGIGWVSNKLARNDEDDPIMLFVIGMFVSVGLAALVAITIGLAPVFCR